MSRIDPTKGIIVSIPYSGLNWVRYCIEFISCQRTPGRPKLVRHGKPIVHRTHHVLRRGGANSCTCSFYNKVGNPLHDKTVLILRHVHESYVRNNWRRCDPRIANPLATAELIRRGQVGSISKYFDNILAFDNYQGPKLLIHYDELISGLEGIHRILAFLGLPCDLTDFDEASHRQRSISIYHDQHRSHTKDDPSNFSYHRTRADPAILEALNFIIDLRYAHSARRYLKGWPS